MAEQTGTQHKRSTIGHKPGNVLDVVHKNTSHVATELFIIHSGSDGEQQCMRAVDSNGGGERQHVSSVESDSDDGPVPELQSDSDSETSMPQTGKLNGTVSESDSGDDDSDEAFFGIKTSVHEVLKRVVDEVKAKQKVKSQNPTNHNVHESTPRLNTVKFNPTVESRAPEKLRNGSDSSSSSQVGVRDEENRTPERVAGTKRRVSSEGNCARATVPAEGPPSGKGENEISDQLIPGCGIPDCSVPRPGHRDGTRRNSRGMPEGTASETGTSGQCSRHKCDVVWKVQGQDIRVGEESRLGVCQLGPPYTGERSDNRPRSEEVHQLDRCVGGPPTGHRTRDRRSRS